MKLLFKEEFESILIAYLNAKKNTKERAKLWKKLCACINKEIYTTEKIEQYKKTHPKKRKLSEYVKKRRAYRIYKRWIKNNKKHVRRYHRNYRRKSHNFFLLYYKNYREKNKSRIQKTRRAWYEQNKLHVHNYNKQYYLLRKAKLSGFTTDI